MQLPNFMLISLVFAEIWPKNYGDSNFKIDNAYDGIIKCIVFTPKNRVVVIASDKVKVTYGQQINTAAL